MTQTPATPPPAGTPDIEASLPLTSLQQGMLFHSLMDPDSGAYFQQLVVELDGELWPEPFAASLEEVVARHQALRCAFLWERRAEPRQVVLRHASPPLEWLDWSVGDDAARLRAWLEADRARPFALNQAPLLRAAVIRLGPRRNRLLVSHHHLILDGWSTGILMEELLALYAARLGGSAAPLPPSPTLAAHLDRLAARDAGAEEGHWREALRGFTEPTPLVEERRAAGATGADYVTHDALLPAALHERLQVAARGARVSGGVPLFAAWGLLLGRRAEREEVVFGVTVAGRQPAMPGADRLVGLFINTVPLRMPTPRAGTAWEWLRQVQQGVSGLNAHGLAPLTDIRRWSELPGSVPLFESIVVYENYSVAAQDPSAPLRVARAHVEERANYPLVLLAEPATEGLHLRLILDRNRLPEEVAPRLLRQLAAVLEGLAESDSRTPCSAIRLMKGAERHRILQEWNATEAPYDAGSTMHGLFLREAAREPRVVALEDAAGSVTYGELEAMSRGIAARIEAAALPEGAAVAVRMRRDRQMVAAVIGVLRAGRAYVPIPLSYPAKRIGDILDSLEVGCFVTQAALAEETRALLGGRAMLVLAAEACEATSGPLTARGDAGSLAYVIFTSGSTGRPKGVMVRHRPVVNLIEWVNRTFGVGPQDRMLFVTSPAFDLSVYDIFGILAAGGRIRIASDEDVADPDRLARILATEPVTFWDSAPAALWQLMPLLPAAVANRALRLVFLSGDWVPLPLPDRLKAAFPGVCVVALGGATEATVWSNFHVVERVELGWRSVPYGRPIQNARYYVLDAALEPVPPGVPSDLFIGGECLSEGYAGQPELTAARFVPDPHWSRPGARMYRTGDRARFFEDGVIEFLGREDDQVKIRGFRIELGEIEEALALHPAVQDAAAALHMTGKGGPASGREEREIVGYVVPRAGVAAEAGAMLDFLRARLPPQMVPAHLVVLEALPLSGNGKVDRKALPAPDVRRGASPRAETVGADVLRDLVAGVWANVLDLEFVPPDEDFFALGGHSLRATSLVAKLRLALGRDLPLALAFYHPTLRAMTAAIRAEMDGEGAFQSQIPILPRGRAMPLSPAQDRMWFLHRLEPDSPVYTIVLAARLRGSLDLGALRAAVEAVAARQEILRCHIVEEDGRPVMVPTAPGTPLPIAVEEAGGTDPEAAARARLAAELRRPFALDRELPFRILVVRLSPEEALALVLMDHIAADGWSIGIFVQEVLAAYDARAEGRAPVLPDLPAQYADWAAWNAARLADGVLERQLSHWRDALRQLQRLDLPADRPRPPVQRFVGDVRAFALSEAQSRGLNSLAREEGCTLFMASLAAFLVVLHQRSGQHNLAVGTDLAGRTHADAERMIGLFVNQLVLRVDITGERSFRDLLRATRGVVLDAFFNQDVPFDVLVRTLNPPRDAARSPLFQVKFVLQNTPFARLGSRHLAVEPLELPTATAKFDLLLTLTDRMPIQGTLEYATDLFEVATAAALVEDLLAVIDQAARSPASPIEDLLGLLQAGGAERQEMARHATRRAGLERLRQLRRPRGAA